MAKEDYFQWAESLLDPSKTFEKPEALADIKIVELCTLILGPSLPSYLSELGATVFKVELPGAGDTMRSLTPFAKFFRGCALGWLKEARPQAARQAIAEARGSVKQLEQAAGYLDRAIVDWPEDEGLRQDRALVAAYLDGAMAFEAGYWNQAIRYWGPLFAAQPGYQDGALERNLREACGASPEPDLALCPP